LAYADESGGTNIYFGLILDFLEENIKQKAVPSAANTGNGYRGQ